MGTDTNELIINIDYEITGYERVPLNARAIKELRYWVEKRFGPEFTSINLFDEMNQWAESMVELPFTNGGDWDFTWNIIGVPRKDQQQWLYEFMKDKPYIPPEIPGQIAMQTTMLEQ